MKRTIFYEKHIELKAKMLPFAGYEMPIEYPGGALQEHLWVREQVGLFDVSHMGEILIEGYNVLDFLQKVTTNDVSKLDVGQAQYSCFTNSKGGIVDDLIVYRLKEHTFSLVVNASTLEQDWLWLNSQNSSGTILDNSSVLYSQLAIQGPKANGLIQALSQDNVAALKPFQFIYTEFAGVKDVIVSNTGYTGAGGYEIYFKNKFGIKIWDALFEEGANYGLKPIGLAARDTLRLEMGYCLYGNDITEETTPLEANLGWIVKFKEGKEFIGRDMLEKQKKEGVNRKLTGILMLERGIPRKGYTLHDEDKNQIGLVTSGTYSPVLKKGIAMAYINTPFAKKDTEIFIQIRNKYLKVKVTKPPFV